MIDWWNSLCLTVFDSLLGWLLDLPSDAALLTVALGTAAIMTLIRRLTTNQDLLGRAAADRKRLGALIRAAKRRRDKSAVQRHRRTKSQIALKTLRAEGWPLLASIVPVAMLATWAWQRLAFHPPAADEPVRVVAHTPISAAGGVMHIVPRDGLQADGWIQPVTAVTDDGPPYGRACWTLRAAAADRPYRLTFRLGERSFEREFRAGGRTYAAPIVYHDDRTVTSLEMRPLKLFGIVPGLPQVYFPPWLVAYLVIVIPAVVLLKRVFRIR